MQPTADRGLSPVVGTVLLIGIVVVLGALTVGAVTFEVGDDLVEPTHAKTSLEKSTAASSADGSADSGSGETVTLAHDGGDTLSMDSIVIRAEASGATTTLSEVTTAASLSAGDRVHFDAAAVGASPDGDHLVVSLERGGQTMPLGSIDTAGYDAGGDETCRDDDHDRGHGNDCDRHDEDNPGNGPGGPGHGGPGNG